MERSGKEIIERNEGKVEIFAAWRGRWAVVECSVMERKRRMIGRDKGGGDDKGRRNN